LTDEHLEALFVMAVVPAVAIFLIPRIGEK
jgi:hypothetical protein